MGKAVNFNTKYIITIKGKSRISYNGTTMAEELAEAVFGAGIYSLKNYYKNLDIKLERET